MKLKLLFLLMTLSPLRFYGQTVKDSLLKADIYELVEHLEFMYGYDQSLREYTLFKTFDKHETDRIESLRESLQKEERKKRSFVSDSLGDFIWKQYINPIDSIHTQKLIDITRKYGFPTNERLKKYYDKEFIDSEFRALLIFIHAPQIYWDDLKSLMKTELDEGRISRCDYGYVLWHVNGRNKFSYLLDNGYKLVKDKNGRERFKAVDCH